MGAMPPALLHSQRCATREHHGTAWPGKPRAAVVAGGDGSRCPEEQDLRQHDQRWAYREHHLSGLHRPVRIAQRHAYRGGIRNTL